MFATANTSSAAQGAHIGQTVKVCISNRASDISIKKSICLRLDVSVDSICLRLDVSFRDEYGGTPRAQLTLQKAHDYF